MMDWVKSVFGVPPPTNDELDTLKASHVEARVGELMEFSHLSCEEVKEMFKEKKLPFPIRRFIKAAQRVGRANKKLIAFERGFISKEGIKEREWYKHLGVAPGKWLGYGATTFPALTEAVVYEKNVEAINEEAGRLRTLLEALSEKIKP